MRFYLDTNILLYMLQRKRDDLSADVWEVVSDSGNILLTSTVCVQELIHLFQIGKIRLHKKGVHTDIEKFSEWLANMYVDLIPVNKKHLQEFARLPLFADHRDPNDRLIVAQAISDRVPLISSDRKFDRYRRYGLDFVYNER